MANVKITIQDKEQIMFCADGQEDHLIQLAAKIDQRMSELRASLGNVSDYKLLLAASLLMMDELDDSLNYLEQLTMKLEKLAD